MTKSVIITLAKIWHETFYQLQRPHHHAATRHVVEMSSRRNKHLGKKRKQSNYSIQCTGFDCRIVDDMYWYLPCGPRRLCQRVVHIVKPLLSTNYFEIWKRFNVNSINKVLYSGQPLKLIYIKPGLESSVLGWVIAVSPLPTINVWPRLSGNVKGWQIQSLMSWKGHTNNFKQVWY